MLDALGVVVMLAVFGGTWLAYKWHVGRVAERLCRRLGLRPLAHDEGELRALIGGAIGDVEVSIGWRRAPKGFEVELVARHPREVPDCAALHELNDDLPLGVAAVRAGNEARIVIGDRSVVLFPTGKLERWARRLAALPGRP